MTVDSAFRPPLRAAALVAAVLVGTLISAGCRPATPSGTHPPIGSFDSVVAGANTVRVAGWALDPDTLAPVGIIVTIDGAPTTTVADRPRADVAAVHPFWGSARGFDITVSGVVDGRHDVCVAAVNVGSGFPLAPLGCRSVVTGRVDPVGSFDTLRQSNFDTVEVLGWAIDPQTADPIDVRVGVDGVAVATARAAASRPDLAGPFPGLGTAHGFAVSVSVTPGEHRVCVVAVNVRDGSDRSLGCRDVTIAEVSPRGVFEWVGVGSNEVVATGWANDPDAPAPATVRMTVRRGATGTALRASASATGVRADVAAALDVDPRAGWTVRSSLSGLEGGGSIEVCVTVDNANRGADRMLGCRTVVVTDHRPVGSVDLVRPGRGGVRVAGWAIDPDVPTASIDIAVSVDGGAATVLRADVSRPDVAAAYPGAGAAHGFDVTLDTLAPGLHRVCVGFRDPPGPATGIIGDRLPPCGWVVLGSTAVGTTGASGPSIGVGPDASNPLARIDRDAGISVELRDGATLWLFGDSMVVGDDGTVRSFVANTAAWAAPGSPAVTHDAAVFGGGIPFVTPSGSFGTCTNPAARQVMWPLSAVAVPEIGTSRDRVIAWFTNICQGPGQQFESIGTSVVDWWYDPALPPRAAAIIGRIVNPVLWGVGQRPFGSAAVRGADGLLYTYSCDGPSGGGWPHEFGPCLVARVDVDLVGSPSAYRYWNGSGWVATRSDAAAMEMPAGGAGPIFPVASLTVTWDDALGVYVMIHSPWPGYTDRVVVRVARSPVGPWTAPVEVELQGCRDEIGDVGYYCYAGTAQPRFSGPGRLGIGYYDQLVSTSPERGQYRVTSVAFDVVFDGP